MPDTSIAPKSVPDGLIIAFEGIDGAGKTTQLELARKTLESEGWQIRTKRNLGGTPIGEALREVVLSDLKRPGATNLYVSVAIQEALIEAISKDRQEGSFILMDRGPLSLAAYELYGESLDPELVWPHVTDGMERVKPDMTIVYAAEVDTAIKRARQKGGKADYYESKSREFFERVASGYVEAAKRYPDQVVVVDANRSIEAVQEQTMQLIRLALSAKSS